MNVSKSRRIVICDDVPEDAEGWRAELSRILPGAVPDREHAVELCPEDELKQGLQNLMSRRAAARGKSEWSESGTVFDGAEIVVIDYDLAHISGGSLITAETMARLCRAFTDTPVILIMNQYREFDFDLSLRGHPDSRADLNIKSEHLSRPRLWHFNADDSSQFRPWYWPELSSAAERQKKRVADLLENGNLEVSILEHLGFTETETERMWSNALGFLHPKDPRSATFRTFVQESGKGTDVKDDRPLTESRHPCAQRAVARIAAARIAKWLDKLVLASQDILVDLPHLVERMPCLVPKDHRNDVTAWNAFVTLEENPKTDADLLRRFGFQKPHWLSRPACWWTRIDEDRELRMARKEDRLGNPNDFVFREDSSDFANRDDSQEFRADFDCIFDRRSLTEVDGLEYGPRVRLVS
ncbi:MAG: hypothetical protein HQM03_14295 [Magnetococcales bacterium]|nr:hypothetical protein [Magnetococcales bacterium]